MYIVFNIITDWQFMIKSGQFDDYIEQLLHKYEQLGPIPGILLTFTESFLPFLPLIVFVIANAAAYGLLQGFLWSWLGSSAGAILVFIIIRKLSHKRLIKVMKRNKQVKKVMQWLERRGFGPLFILMCFPFSPSSVINIVSGLSKITMQQFILAVIMGKAVMIFSIAYIGANIMSFARNPVKAIIVGICIFAFWILGKIIETRLQRDVNVKHHNYDIK